MSITFRPALRESVGILIGLAGASGSGKTYSALRLASGIAGDKPFAMIDTENRRALHYADRFKFEHAELRAPFRPEAYAEAIMTADKAGYSVIVVDSASHEHAGDGGLLDWHEEELDRLGGSDYAKRERAKMSAWIKPKMAHKQMMSKLLQVRAHLILCFRAEEKVDIVKGEDGKTRIVPKQSLTGLAGWVPICEKTLPYELTASFLLTADAPGIPKPIKLQEQHRALFPLDQPIAEESGRLIAQWASGGACDHSRDLPSPLGAIGQPGIPSVETVLRDLRAASSVETVLRDLRAASLEGTAALSEKWQAIGKEMRHALAEQLPSLKEAAARVTPTPIGDAP